MDLKKGPAFAGGLRNLMTRQTHFTRLLAIVSLLLGGLAAGYGEVRLPRVFSSHMVLQQQKPLIVWGWADPGEKVEVRLGEVVGQGKANKQGEWKITLPAQTAGGPHVLKIEGNNTVTFEDVMVGEVWLCSGQSNMEMGIAGTEGAKEQIAAANYPLIRLLMVPNKWTAEPQQDIESASWKVCSPATITEGGWGGFSAAAYYFGRELHKNLGVAVGLIDASWGGTCAQTWTPPEGFGMVPELKNEYARVLLADPQTSQHEDRLNRFLNEMKDWMDKAREAKESRKLVPAMPGYPEELLPPRDVQHATALYNGMIYPLRPFAMRGAIWYQGESNLSEGALYTERMKALVRGWRKVWDQGEFPFFFVQIAPYNYGGDPERVGVFWEAQAQAAQAIPNSGMAVINDIGDLKDIHPTNKQEVGRRLALWALAKTYGSKVVYSGPVFKEVKIEGDRLRVVFDHADGGLSSRDGKPLNWFELIDAEEGGFVTAEARIEGNAVVLSSPEVKRPVAARFAWSMLAEPNLVNGAGLPAGAFRAGNMPKRDYLALKVPESKHYKLVYDLDLANLGAEIKWDENHCNKMDQPFDRIAYYLELQKGDGGTDYVYVSMEAFTKSLDKIGVPTAASGARFQQKVAELVVFSNVKGVVTGSNLPGNIEFWPNNYGPQNAAHVANASATAYDWGDEPSEPSDGYGSMQIHNAAAKQTLFAINHWREGSRADVGIGNQPKNNPDWTFAANAGNYKAKRLKILVRPR